MKGVNNEVLKYLVEPSPWNAAVVGIEMNLRPELMLSNPSGYFFVLVSFI